MFQVGSGLYLQELLGALKHTGSINFATWDEKRARYNEPSGGESNNPNYLPNTIYIDLNYDFNNKFLHMFDIPMPLEILIAHELGHANGVFDSPFPGEAMANVNAWENPIRWWLGLPSRTRYSW